MNKRKLIILITSIFLMFSSIVVLASFVFHKIVTISSTTGTIEVDEMYFGIRNDDGITYQEAKGKHISCYATKKQGWSSETDDIQLNQLSLKFKYTTTFDVYVRIHIEDAWISTKTYTNGLVSTTYIEKGKITGVSPFKPSDTNWVYDEATNCIYYKTRVIVGDAEKLDETHEFKLDNTYFYQSSQSTSYREHVMVHVSYYVDIVQANRAEKKWQVSFEELGIN